MDYSENAYTVSQGLNENTIPLIYGKEDVLIKELYDAEKLRTLGNDVTRYFNGAGKTMQIPIDEYHWAVSRLTEKVKTPISDLKWGSKTMTFNWYGDAKQWTMESEAVVSSYTLSDMRGKALKALGENRDDTIINELLETTSDAIYPFKANGTKESDSDVASEFQYRQVLSARVKMTMDRLALSYVIYHPLQEASLLANEKIIDNNFYSNNVLERGVIKDIYGTKFIAHNRIQSVTENSKTVYIALACMDKPFFYAQKRVPVYELSRGDIRARAWTFHYYEAFGVKIVRDKGIIPLKSVGATI